jgi:hypothetical protein
MFMIVSLWLSILNAYLEKFEKKYNYRANDVSKPSRWMGTKVSNARVNWKNTQGTLYISAQL